MKLLLSFISSLILVVFLSFSSSAFADSQIDSSSSVLKVVEFSRYQISDDLLIEQALEGHLVNNDYTTVEVKENSEDETQIIEITKLLSIITMEDGQEVTEYSKSATVLTNISNQTDASKIENTIRTPLLASVSNPTGGSKTEYSGDGKVSIKVELNYYKIVVNGTSAYRLNFYKLTPSVNVARTTITSITSEARSHGSGYLIDGTPYSKTETTGINTWTNPIGFYSMATGFSKFVIPNTFSGSGAGVNGFVNYKNTRYGTTDRFHYSLSI